MVIVKTLKRPDFECFFPYQEQFFSLLSERERASIERTRKPKDKIEKTMGWIICRMEAAQRYHVHPADIKIDFYEKGKPFFPDFPELTFNITHGGNVIAVAFSDGNNIGIDVESIARKVNLMIAERHFTPYEASFLQSIPEAQRQHAYLRIWTIKEAYLKMIGTGLTRPLDSFEVHITENGVKIFDDNILQTCTVIQNEDDNEHIITISVENSENKFDFAAIDIQSMINFVEKNKR